MSNEIRACLKISKGLSFKRLSTLWQLAQYIQASALFAVFSWPSWCDPCPAFFGTGSGD